MTRRGSRAVGWLLAAALAASMLQSGCDRDAAPGTEIVMDDEMLARLEAIGYVGAREEARAQSGVVHHDPARASSGAVLYTSGHGPEAFLIDVDGKPLHRWHADPAHIWPGAIGQSLSQSMNFFRRAHLFENGDLLVIFEGHGLVLLDHASRVRWKRLNLAHHAVLPRPDGSLYVLTRAERVEPAVDPDRKLLVDFVTELDPQRRPRRRVPILQALLASPWADMAATPPPDMPPRAVEKFEQGDLHHTNSLHLIERDHPTVPGLRAGTLLLSSATLSAIFALDLDTRRVTWLHRGDFLVQHEPTMLENGNILLFDNNTSERGSRVIEIDPATGDVVWQFPGAGSSERFFSYCCGTARRLPGGNTFVAITSPGRVVEVTPEGDLVWDFRNPHRSGLDGELVASVFDALKLPADFPLGWADEATTRARDGGPSAR